MPVLLAGGPKTESPRAFLEMAVNAVKGGAAGLSVGRNVFQHPNPRLLVAALSGVVHQNWTLDQALEAIRGEDA